MEGFFTLLIGITCFGILLFLVYGLAAKISGKNVVSRGQTIADPDMLDAVGRGLRKAVDKKYKVRIQIEQEMIEELAKTVGPLDRLISACSFMAVTNFSYSQFNLIQPDQKFILNAIGFFDTLNNEAPLKGIIGRALTPDEIETIQQIHVELYKQKMTLTEEITGKYAKKKDELLRYL